jgi:hypothetical protein
MASSASWAAGAYSLTFPSPGGRGLGGGGPGGGFFNPPRPVKARALNRVPHRQELGNQRLVGCVLRTNNAPLFPAAESRLVVSRRRPGRRR